NTTNFAPMPWASFKRFFSLETALDRLSERCKGPSCAAAVLRCLAMALSNEFPELAGGPVDFSRRGSGHRPGDATREELSGAARHLQCTAFDDDAPATGHDLRPALVDVPLVGRVADRVVHHRVVDAFLDFRIPDGEVGVRAYGDRALARVQPVHARMIGRTERDKLVDAEPPLEHALGKEDR